MLTTYRKIASIFLLFTTLIGCVDTKAAEISQSEIQIVQETQETIPEETEHSTEKTEDNEVVEETVNETEPDAHTDEDCSVPIPENTEPVYDEPECTVEEIEEEKSETHAILWPEKYCGRLTIPDVGVDVALYYCASVAWENPQYIVDAEDSAVMECFDDFLYVPGGHVIADHYNQGFEAMKSSVPYETRA